MTGNNLTVVPLSSGSDTGDLLGGYEQADAPRRFNHLIHRSDQLVRDSIHAILEHQLITGEQIHSATV